MNLSELMALVARRAGVGLSLAGSVLCSTALQAAPPLSTDDASTLLPGTCQLEIEFRRFRRSTEEDIVPVCNFLLDTEFGIGRLRVAPQDAPATHSVVFQFKKVLISGEQADWSFGIAGATIHAAGREAGIRQNQFNTLLSRQVGPALLHLNLGLVRDREAAGALRANRMTWAMAFEQDFNSRLTIVGEVFGERGLPHTALLGLRWWVLPRYVQLTGGFGAQRGEGRDGRWTSLGIRFETGDPVF
jgi:hypothetical protein